jgi:hypothetical protein
MHARRRTLIVANHLHVLNHNHDPWATLLVRGTQLIMDYVFETWLATAVADQGEISEE